MGSAMGMMRKLLPFVLACFALSGCMSEQARQRAALEAYLFPMLEEADDTGSYELCHTSADAWYLIRWKETDLIASPHGVAYPLSHDPDTIVHQDSADFEITAEVVQRAPTVLALEIVNESDRTITMTAIRWLNVELDGIWYRLLFQGAHNDSAMEIEPGERCSMRREIREGRCGLTLPAGHYRWCFTIRVDEADVWSAVEFDIPADG